MTAASKAAVVNERGPAEDAMFEALVAPESPEVQAIARSLRSLVYDVLPQTVEVMWPHQRTVGYGTGPKKMTEHFAYLLPYRTHVTFGFYYGAELPDPAGLLSGEGKLMRSIKVGSLAEVARPELRTLIEASTRHRVPSPRSDA